MTAVTTKPIKQVFGGIEAGGTKFNCVAANQEGQILHSAVYLTESPEKTLANVAQFFTEITNQFGQLNAIGIGSFGPIELNKQSRDYGCIKTTPKFGWSNVNVVNFFQDKFEIPVAFDTDVNAAALGEFTLGAAKGCHDFVYVTIGTGIGAGIMVDGKLVHGLGHPEVGHILIPRHGLDDPKISCCPFHDSCLEGLASGSSLQLRCKEGLKALPSDHALWQVEAYYLAVMCVNLTQAYAPQKIVLSGGVMNQSHLFSKVHSEFLRLINGYAHENILSNVANYIVPTGLKGNAGVLGAIHLAMSLV